MNEVFSHVIHNQWIIINTCEILPERVILNLPLIIQCGIFTEKINDVHVHWFRRPHADVYIK